MRGAESRDDMLARLDLMQAGDDKWDLSDNDRAAIREALADVRRLDWLEAKVLERDVEITLTNVDGDIPHDGQPEWICITPLNKRAITGSDLRAAIDAALSALTTTTPGRGVGDQ